MLEKTVEAYLVERVRALGGEPYKFTSPARASVPDRIVVLPPGRVYFIEVKRPGGKLTRGQEREHEHLRRLGADVRVLDSIGAINAFVNEVQAVAAPVAPDAPVAEYDGNHVQNHCTECNEHEAECTCTAAVAADGEGEYQWLAETQSEFVSALILAICELPDRHSPADEPGAMVANSDEIAHCVDVALEKTGLSISRRAAVSPATAEPTDYAAIEREHFGDPDKRTGIYAPATADERHEDGLLTTEALISIIERHFDHDHPDGQRLVEMAQDVAASQHKQGEPATADELAAFLVWWTRDVPEELRRDWVNRNEQFLREGKACEALARAWEGWQARASQAAAPAEAREPSAWVTPEGDRSITQSQKQGMLRDGGAGASSVRPFSIACYAGQVPADAGEAVMPPKRVEEIMAQARVFASAWSLVGGRFDQGDALETAEQEKQNLRDLVSGAQGGKGGDRG
ncbi:hypothetical protein B7760_01778 [Burkholderia glumae]|uniref:VRR-NUC domain-containing protein n=1 Tax=Burkholderia glumae TaxID=337 RepID=UPI00209522FC|nr:VRR-NUC domain-containing protein [Burkholderia glumae]QKM47754.1 hypothetical protein B7760_01778 [Burkholderia glumae]